MINKDISQQELKTLRSPAPNMAVNIGGNFGEIKASFTIHPEQILVDVTGVPRFFHPVSGPRKPVEPPPGRPIPAILDW
jgi:hypothetical protein